MLIVTRKKLERIAITENIEIVVLGISDNRVKLGIKSVDDGVTWQKELTCNCDCSLPRKPR